VSIKKSKKDKILRSIVYFPEHVAIIQDGNRRYAKKHGLTVQEGHQKGAEKTIEILTWATDLNIHHVTVFAFSTENFQRAEDEKEGLHNIFLEKFHQMLDNPHIIEHQINITVIGDRGLISPELIKEIEKVEEMTKDFHRYYVHIAIAYGGQNEIIHTAERLRGVDNINEETVTEAMYPGIEIPPVDIMVRTANESRTSNFVPWLSYGNSAIFYKIKRTWPEIRYKDLLKALKTYNKDITSLSQKKR